MQMFKKWFKQKKQVEVEVMIGLEGVVTRTILPMHNKGRVKIREVEYEARLSQRAGIVQGNIVTVVKKSGNVLYVEEKELTQS